MTAEITNSKSQHKQVWITPALSEIDVARRTQGALVDSTVEDLLNNDSNLLS